MRKCVLFLISMLLLVSCSNTKTSNLTEHHYKTNQSNDGFAIVEFVVFESKGIINCVSYVDPLLVVTTDDKSFDIITFIIRTTNGDVLYSASERPVKVRNIKYLETVVKTSQMSEKEIKFTEEIVLDIRYKEGDNEIGKIIYMNSNR